MEKDKAWRNKSSLREKISLMELLGKAPMEVADPIAYLDYFPENKTNNYSILKDPEQK